MGASLRLLALVVITAAGLAAQAAAQYSSCGTIEAGVTCPRLFRDTQGALWLLQDYGGHQVGDVVQVTGNADPYCMNLCMQGNGCIAPNTIGPCDPTSGFCFCASGAPCGNVDASGGCANSTGVGAQLSGSGSTSVAADDLVLHARRMPSGQNGLVFMGSQPVSYPFGAGLRCVGAGFFGVARFPLQTADNSGAFDVGPLVGFANAHFPPFLQIAPGSTWLFQCWYRDPSGPCGATTNLSNAVSATFTP